MYKMWFEWEAPDYCLELIEGTATVTGPATLTPNSPFSAVAESHAVIASGLRYNAAMMDAAPNVLVICRTGIGYDNVDISAATERGIAVCNAPDGPTISTAEHALALMFAVAKKIKATEQILHNNPGKTDIYKDHFGIELYGKRLGLIGLGRIGSRVAQVAQAMDMTVTAYDPFVQPEQAQAIGVELATDLNDLLARADVISLHAPLTDTTRHTINAAAIASMKPGAVLINTSRGGLVDETALLAALESGHLAGAGLDVTDPEPPLPENPLMHMDNVVITPHIASGTASGKERIWTTSVRQALQVLAGERPPYLLNGDAWDTVLARLNTMQGG